MAREAQDLTHPSLQRGRPWPWLFVPVAERDYFRHTLDVTGDNRANSLYDVDSMPAVPEPGCPGSQDLTGAWLAATAADARAGIPLPSSMIVWGIEGVDSKVVRTRRIA